MFIFLKGFGLAKIGKPRSSKGLAVFCARLAEEKLAKDVLLLDLTKVDSSPAEYFVIATCDSVPQVAAVADLIMDKVSEVGLSKPKTEGFDAKEWVLMDFFDVVTHVMLRESRDYYKIEKLWADANFFCLNEEGAPKAFDRKKLNELYLTNSAE